jgi:hypothetical protein
MSCHGKSHEHADVLRYEIIANNSREKSAETIVDTETSLPQKKKAQQEALPSIEEMNCAL